MVYNHAIRHWWLAISDKKKACNQTGIHRWPSIRNTNKMAYNHTWMRSQLANHEKQKQMHSMPSHRHKATQCTAKSKKFLPPLLLLQYPRRGLATDRTSDGRETVSLNVIYGMIFSHQGITLWNKKFIQVIFNNSLSVSHLTQNGQNAELQNRWYSRVVS